MPAKQTAIVVRAARLVAATLRVRLPSPLSPLLYVLLASFCDARARANARSARKLAWARSGRAARAAAAAHLGHAAWVVLFQAQAIKLC